MNIYLKSGMLGCVLLFATYYPGIAQDQKKEEVISIRGWVVDFPGALPAADTVILRERAQGRPVELKIPVCNGEFAVGIPKTSAGIAFVGMDCQKTERDGTKTGTFLTAGFIKEDTVRIILDKTLERITIIGGRQNQALMLYSYGRDEMNGRINALQDKLRERSRDSSACKEALSLAYAERDQRKKQFIIDHPYALQSLYLLEDFVKDYLGRGWTKDPEEIELKAYKRMFFSLEKPVQETGSRLLALLENAEKKTVPTFTGQMPDGKQFDLSSLKGKVVLIDFWGSWCGWCRKAHPHLKELYAQYKDKGFEIVGVGQEYGSRDEQWRKFKSAINEDGLPWIQVLNDPREIDVVAEYGVKRFPSKFLIDRDGRLVLRSTGANERMLDARLEELLGIQPE